LDTIAVIVLACGLLGGFRNFLSDYPSSSYRCVLFLQRLLEGILAAAIVPLFLSMIGNELIPDLTSASTSPSLPRPYAILQFIGFALVAALYSRRFLDTVSSKLLQLEQDVKKSEAKADRAQEDVNKTAHEVTTLEDIVIESPIPPSAELSPSSQTFSLAPGPELKVLEAMETSHIPARSVEGLSVDVQDGAATVTATLSKLQAHSLVRAISTSRGERWVLTELGRLTLKSRR